MLASEFDACLHGWLKRIRLDLVEYGVFDAREFKFAFKRRERFR